MAKTPRADIIEQFEQVALQLIQEAANYAASGEPNEDVERSIRRLRTISGALNAALMSAQAPVRMPEPPQPLPPPEGLH